ncbi:hypothetical protein C7S14_4581 [Burkholderia cepacia]|nr:hypothetical protein C7S14_4581 [Burkholderia cepacia]
MLWAGNPVENCQRRAMAAPDRIPHRLSPCLVVIDGGARHYTARASMACSVA